jgi:hypothetical protein
MTACKHWILPHFLFVVVHCFINVFFLIADDEVVKREEEAIKLDGLNVAQIKELREKAEKFAFQAEVNRMMKLIINSLYRNKEVSSLEVVEFLDKCISCKRM